MPDSEVNHLNRIPRPALRGSAASDARKRVALREILSQVEKYLWWTYGYKRGPRLDSFFELAKRVDAAQTEGELQDLLRQLDKLR